MHFLQKDANSVNLLSTYSCFFSDLQIMPRAQNAHAIINAGFLFKIANDNVEECRIVYGGVNPKFIHATQTEAFLQGRKLYDNGILQKAYEYLDQEVVCDYIPPDATPTYRKNLAISLFYKV